MAIPVRTSNFPNLSTQDTISLTISPDTPGVVTIVLEKIPGMTWWKGIEVYAANGTLLARAQMQDGNNGPSQIIIPIASLNGAKLVLAKAKMWGIHTGMYELSGLSAHNGQRLHFLWQRDEDRDGPVAGFFRDLGNAVDIVTDAVADVVETVVNTIFEVVKVIVEAIGTFLANILDAIGNALGGIPLLGQILRVLFHWVATVVSAAFSLLAVALKAIGDIVAGVSAGIIRVGGGMIGGLFGLNSFLLVKGLGDIIASIVGPVVVILGKTIALVQATVFMQMGERALTELETTMLRRVFRNSVSLYNVRVVDGFAGLFSVNDLAFTLGNTIYMKNTDPATYLSVLVHECVHVWQNQHHGQRYVADALWSQWTIPGSGYEWQSEFAAGRVIWRDFNREAQAKLIQDVFDDGKQIPARGTVGEFYIDDPIGLDVTFIDPDRTAFARDSIAYMRSIFPLVHWR